jgi:preprotein translocase subunit SecA
MLETLFQNTTQQVLSKYKGQLNQINSFTDDFKKLSDSELKKKTQQLSEYRSRSFCFS